MSHKPLCWPKYTGSQQANNDWPRVFVSETGNDAKQDGTVADNTSTLSDPHSGLDR